MPSQQQFITLREGSDASAVIAPELGGWLLQYSRRLPGYGLVDALHFSQEIVDRYPNQMYAGTPLLFPMVSYNHLPGLEHHYEWNGVRYPLPQHGFARRTKWRTVRTTDNSLLMELTDTPETLKVYPFHFACQVQYELRNGALIFHQRIENRSDQPMPFSAGIHPYFKVPFASTGSRDACYVEFSSARHVQTSDEWKTWAIEPLSETCIPASRDVSGTFFLTDLSRPELRLVDPASNIQLIMDLKGASAHKYVALWSKNVQEPYYCIEPWTALPNSFTRAQADLLRLAPGAAFSAEISLLLQ